MDVNRGELQSHGFVSQNAMSLFLSLIRVLARLFVFGARDT